MPNIPPGGRDAELKVLRGPELGRIDPIFATIRPGWDRRVTVYWTDGSDEHWPEGRDDDPNTAIAGTVPFGRVHVWDVGRSMDAEVLVDLQVGRDKALMPAFGQPAVGGVQDVSLNLFRHALFRTLCHELLHVVQNWVKGPDAFADDYADQMWRGQYDDPFNLSPPSYIQGRPRSIFDGSRGYERNIYERTAFDFGKQKLSEHLQALNAEKFDDILPIERMRKMVTDWSTANPVPKAAPGKANRIRP
jgi:hypothetical protein